MNIWKYPQQATRRGSAARSNIDLRNTNIATNTLTNTKKKHPKYKPWSRSRAFANSAPRIDKSGRNASNNATALNQKTYQSFNRWSMKKKIFWNLFTNCGGNVDMQSSISRS